MHATFILTTGGIKVIISALVEDCISLIVCNLPVVATSLLRLVDHDRKPPPTTSIITNSLHFAVQKLGMSKGSNTFDTSINSTTESAGIFPGSMHTAEVIKALERPSSPIMLDLLDRYESGKGAPSEKEESFMVPK